MMSLAAIFPLAAIQGVAITNLAQVLIVLTVVVIAVLLRRTVGCRLIAKVVGVCLACALLFLLMPLSRRGPIPASREVTQPHRIRITTSEGFPRGLPDDSVGEFTAIEEFEPSAPARLEDGGVPIAPPAVIVGGGETSPVQVSVEVPTSQRARTLRSRVDQTLRRSGGLPLPWTVISALALAVMIYLAYLFLDAGTRGQFSWALRLFSALAFIALCGLLIAYGR